jgi:DNA-binding CsgD family transcriptional regulator
MKPLTKQERYILFYASFQQPNKDIAEAMGLQVNTVKVHKHNLYKKLGLTGLTKEAAIEGLNSFIDDYPDLLDGLFPGMEDEAENLNEDLYDERDQVTYTSLDAVRETLDRRYDEAESGEVKMISMDELRADISTWVHEGSSDADLAG